MNVQEKIKMGLDMEAILHPVFESKFGKLNQTSQYHNFDYENDNVLVELKTRNVVWKQYPSLMFNQAKIDYLTENNITKDAYFFWKLKDSLVFWKFNKDEYRPNDCGGCVYIENQYIKNYNDLEFQKWEFGK
tara:strand:+ start:99 stop:494 length:396 start_codon:yes stop_codon:yes gene_type:complete